jgi:hypothetical protein
MLEDGRAVTRQVLNEPDGAPLGLADQLGEPSLALDQRQVAQVVAVMLDQVEGVQYRLMAPRRLRSARKSGIPSSLADRATSASR